jgi:nucleoside permease NupC
MFSAVAKFLLILTALSPIALVYGWVTYTEKYYWASMGSLSLCIVLTIVTLYLLHSARKYLERFEFKFNAAEPVDQENITFFLLYLSPLFVDKLSTLNFNVLVPVLFIYALLTATSYAYHFNPLLSLMGWHFFKITSTEGISYVILTRKKIINVDSISQVGQLTDYMLIDLTEK